jgi:ATP-dependent DNA helicase RecQ
VLRNERRLSLRKELPSRKERDRNVRGSIVVPPADMSLFGALRELRAQLAREQNVPAYVIFHDSTLRNIAEHRPVTLTELAQVGGIGGTKLSRYGERLIELVREQG